MEYQEFKVNSLSVVLTLKRFQWGHSFLYSDSYLLQGIFTFDMHDHQFQKEKNEGAFKSLELKATTLK